MTFLRSPAQWVPVLLILIGMLPMLLVYLGRLWIRTHYQFFPMLLAAAGYLLYTRWKMIPPPLDASAPPVEKVHGTWWLKLRPFLALGFIALGLCLQFISTRVYSPWLGYVGFLLAGLGLVEYLGGYRLVPLLPVWALMGLILMPPADLDSRLIVWLQQTTAVYTGRVLDTLGVDHLREGVLIEIPARTLFVEEACSGVQSLFSLVAIAAVLCVWHRRSLVHAVLLFLLAVVGAGGLNVVRTVAIAYGLDQVGIDLMSEPQHSILGLIVFFVGLGWLVCCDGFLTFLLGPIQGADESVDWNLWVRLWNRLVAQDETRDLDRVRYQLPSSIQTFCRGAMFVLAAGGVLVGASSVRAVVADWQGKNRMKEAVAAGDVLGKLSGLEESSLPAQVEGWTRAGYQSVDRSEVNLLGQHSRIWTYKTPFGAALVSVDYPFNGWHDLRTCYTGIGWLTSGAQSFSSAGHDGLNDILQFTLQKPGGESALVVYTAVNELLDPVRSYSFGTVGRTFRERTRALLSATQVYETVAQVQILLSPERPLTSDEQAEVRLQLERMRDLITGFVRKQGGAQP